MDLILFALLLIVVFVVMIARLFIISNSDDENVIQRQLNEYRDELNKTNAIINIELKKLDSSINKLNSKLK